MKMVFMPHRLGGGFLLAGALRSRRAGLRDRPSRADQLIVAASYQFVAERVAGEHGDVTSLTSRGASRTTWS